jgi:acyl carrier protein
MFEYVEPRVRGLVAEHLGVGADELRADVSLVEDLAADSLDLVELALVLESHFGVVVPESVIERMRTYGELVTVVVELLRRRHDAETEAEVPAAPALVWARVVQPGAAGGNLQRGDWLTPYSAETIAEDALRAGRGARLELSVPSSLTDAGLASVRDQFAWLCARGIIVSVRRDHQVGALGHSVRPHAA